MSRAYPREKVLESIKGSGGIMSTVASRLGCAWDTAKRYVNLWAGTKQAFGNEREQFIDACETVLMTNIRLAQKAQRDGEYVDTGDAKWVLSRMAKDRGYSKRQESELDITTGGEKLKMVPIYLPDNERE